VIAPQFRPAHARPARPRGPGSRPRASAMWPPAPAPVPGARAATRRRAERPPAPGGRHSL